MVQARRFADVAVIEANDLEAARREELAQTIVPEDALRADAHDEEHRDALAHHVVGDVDTGGDARLAGGPARRRRGLRCRSSGRLGSLTHGVDDPLALPSPEPFAPPAKGS